MNTKIKTIIISLVAAGSFAATTVAPAVSQAKPAQKSAGKGCDIKVRGGASYTVPDGGYVIRNNPDGTKEKHTCNDGVDTVEDIKLEAASESTRPSLPEVKASTPPAGTTSPVVKRTTPVTVGAALG